MTSGNTTCVGVVVCFVITLYIGVVAVGKSGSTAHLIGAA